MRPPTRLLVVALLVLSAGAAPALAQSSSTAVELILHDAHVTHPAGESVPVNVTVVNRGARFASAEVVGQEPSGNISFFSQWTFVGPGEEANLTLQGNSRFDTPPGDYRVTYVLRVDDSVVATIEGIVTITEATGGPRVPPQPHRGVEAIDLSVEGPTEQVTRGRPANVTVQVANTGETGGMVDVHARWSNHSSRGVGNETSVFLAPGDTHTWTARLWTTASTPEGDHDIHVVAAARSGPGHAEGRVTVEVVAPAPATPPPEDEEDVPPEDDPPPDDDVEPPEEDVDDAAALQTTVADSRLEGRTVHHVVDVHNPTDRPVTVALHVAADADGKHPVGHVSSNRVDVAAGETTTVRVEVPAGADALLLARDPDETSWRVVADLHAAAAGFTDDEALQRQAADDGGGAVSQVLGSSAATAALVAAAAAAVVAGAVAAWRRREDLPYLGAIPVAWLYTRLKKQEVLDHDTRAAIHKLVVDRPGIRFSELRRELDLHVGALVHHLRMLEQHHLVVSRREGATRRFYPAGPKLPPAPERRLTDTQQHILDLLDRRALTQREVAEALGVTQQGASYHLKNLARRGHVEYRLMDGEWRYRPVPQALEVVASAEGRTSRDS